MHSRSESSAGVSPSCAARSSITVERMRWRLRAMGAVSSRARSHAFPGETLRWCGRNRLECAHAVLPASTVITVPVMFFARSTEQKFYCVGHIFHLDQSLERATAHDLFALLVLHAPRHFGIDETWSNGIHGDPQLPTSLASERVKPTSEALEAL